MLKDFYRLAEYRQKQSRITKEKWKNGVFDFTRKRESRICKRGNCGNKFSVKPSDPKVYCSHRCVALVNNHNRGPLPEETKLKISKSLVGRKFPYSRAYHSGGRKHVVKVEIICGNPKCQKIFQRERWMKRKYCCVNCAMAVIGGKSTSPKASRGKAGIRKDISDAVYFHSRWEANIARLFNYLKIKWIYEPKSFDLIIQKYTPDFYLPELDMYIEVKNFMWKYSQIRDNKFRELFPDINLKLILKDQYLKLEKEYSKFIINWEFKNSKYIEII